MDFPIFIVRFVASETGKDHSTLIEFSDLKYNPLEHPSIDELNRKLLNGFTQKLSVLKNGDGAWEVQFKL